MLIAEVIVDMSDDTDLPAGMRFARDMRRVREDRDVTPEEVHDRTQIPLTLIASFEEGGLYDHPAFNEVYLRSFVRAYAEAVDMSPEQVLEGLEAALEGSYQNALAEQYLHEELHSPSEEGEPPSEEATAQPEEADGETQAEDDVPSDSSRSSVGSTEEEAEEVVVDPQAKAAATEGEPTPTGHSTGDSGGGLSSPPQSTFGSSSWRRPLLGVAVVLSLTGIGLWYVLAEHDSASTGESSPFPASDTIAEATPPDTSASSPSQSPERTSLGETLHLTMQADTNVSRILVQRDEDLRRPYWIRQDEVVVFPFSDRIVVEEELDDVSLYLEGFSFSPSADTTDRIVVDREWASSFVDTVRGSPVQWSTAPDTIPPGSPDSVD